MSKKKNIWNYDKKWVRWLDDILLVAILFLMVFGNEVIRVISVNRHPVKVKAVIIDKCHISKPPGASRRYYYEYKYNDTLYTGEHHTNINNLYGEIGDTIVIRCNKNNPSQSIINCNDFPNRILEAKEYREYLKNEPSCF